MASYSKSFSSSDLMSPQNRFKLRQIGKDVLVVKEINGYVGELDGATKTTLEESSTPLVLPSITDSSEFLFSFSFPYAYGLLLKTKTMYAWKIVREGFSFEPINPTNVVFLGNIKKKALNCSGIRYASAIEMNERNGGVRLDITQHKTGPQGGIKKKSFQVSVYAETIWKSQEKNYRTFLPNDGVSIKEIFDDDS